MPLKAKLTLSVRTKRLKNWPEMKNGQINKNQAAIRDTGWVIKTINMATVREF
jgi:hypothetical protein